jgi:hypothetical protein
MRGRDPLMMLADGDRLGRLKKTACSISEFLEIH